MRMLTALLLLAACSPSSGEESAKAGEPVSRTSLSASARVLTRDSGAVPRPGVLRTFDDWTVGCDNVLTCTLASLGAESADFPAATVAVTRDAGPRGGITVALAGRDGAPRPVALAIDGRVFDPAHDGKRIAAAMVKGHVLTIRDGHGGTIATQSLAGASAALRYVDAVQKRAGSVTALVARGDKAINEVPAAPSLPVVVAIVSRGTATLPDAARLAALSRQARCEVAAATEYWKPVAHALGGGATLVMLPCSSGAYNLLAALFVVKNGMVVPAAIDAPAGFAATGAGSGPVPNVVNGDFADGLLTSYAKGRGLGDCGDRQVFAWDGTRFRLTEQADMGQCRGNPNYITTWRTRVVRR